MRMSLDDAQVEQFPPPANVEATQERPRAAADVHPGADADADADADQEADEDADAHADPDADAHADTDADADPLTGTAVARRGTCGQIVRRRQRQRRTAEAVADPTRRVPSALGDGSECAEPVAARRGPTRWSPRRARASAGRRATRSAGHPWWTPVRVVLAVAALAFVLGMVQKTPCVRDDWSGDKLRYARDVLLRRALPLHRPRLRRPATVPYTDNGGRYQAMEYPVLIGYFAYGAAVVTQRSAARPTSSERRLRRRRPDLRRSPASRRSRGRYFVVTAVLLAPFALLSAWFLAGVHRRRPWDAMLFAASPALVLTGLINWDLLAVAAVAGALWAWSRGRPVLTGVLIGLGTATKLYPLFLLGALLVVCLRRGRLPRVLRRHGRGGRWPGWPSTCRRCSTASTSGRCSGRSTPTAAPTSARSGWSGSRLGTPSRRAWSTRSPWSFFGAVCLGVLVLGLRARRTPADPAAGAAGRGRVPAGQQGVLAAVRPLAAAARRAGPAALARPADLAGRRGVLLRRRVALPRRLHRVRRRAGSRTGSTGSRSLVRVAAEVYLAVVVVRDILQPWRDPVRADGLTDDPMARRDAAPGRRAEAQAAADARGAQPRRDRAIDAGRVVSTRPA